MKPANLILGVGVLGFVVSLGLMATMREPGPEAFGTGCFVLSLGTMGVADLWRRRQKSSQWTVRKTMAALAFAGTYVALMVLLAMVVGK